jgi:hypothetical protein
MHLTTPLRFYTLLKTIYNLAVCIDYRSVLLTWAVTYREVYYYVALIDENLALIIEKWIRVSCQAL